MQIEGIIALHKIVKLKAPESGSVTEGETNLWILQGIAEKPNLTLFGSEPKYETPLEKAACLLEAIARLHPFTDGNKRTALLTAYSFLQFEGYYLDLRLVDPHFLVYVASNNSRTEKEIDMIIEEIVLYFKQRLQNEFI